MNIDDLEADINELADFPAIPAAVWVAKFNAAPTEAIAGAILRWVAGSVMTAHGPDPNSSRREAAQAILRKRLTDQSISAIAALQKTIDTYQAESGRQITSMIRLTRRIVALTIVLTVLTAVLVWRAFIAP
jgi:hypothetical protein